MRKEFHFLLYLIIAFFLFLGNNSDRIKKAQFLSKTVYLPLIASIQQFDSLIDSKNKNQILSEKLANYTIKLTEMKNQLQEIKNFNINFDTNNYEHILADIVGFKGEFEERCLIINKGLNDKIKLDYPVIASEGIVGKIVSISKNYSIVLPLDHSRFKLGVMSDRTHLQGIMKSDIFGNSFMTLIKPGSDIKVGDIIVTSQISSVFPKGYPIGKVIKLIEAPTEVFMSARIQTFINPSELDQLIILLYEKDESYEEELENN